MELLADESVPHTDPTQLDTLKSEINRLKDCLNAREELINGLREDISLRQEKESNYREKVAELYSQIESKEVEQVKDVIDFSDSFVSGLEEQLSVAQRIIKIKEDEICGLNKALHDLSSQPVLPSSPLPRSSNIDNDELDDCKAEIADLTNRNKNLNEEMITLQSALDDKDCEINTLSKQIEEKTSDIEKIQKEYEAEMMNMSVTYREQKAVNTDELEYLTQKIKELEGDNKDLVFENRSLFERFKRASEDYEALRLQLESDELGPEDMESTAHQVKYNLKEQQLQNALSEIHRLNEGAVAKSAELSELEETLSHQRQINVGLQERIDDLLERCEVLENKESDYLLKIEELKKELDDLSINSNEDIQSLVNALKASKEGYSELSKKNQAYIDYEKQLKHSIKDLHTFLKELQLSKETLKADVQKNLNEVTTYWRECFETLHGEISSSYHSPIRPTVGSLESALCQIKQLRLQHDSMKSKVESILQTDFTAAFLEFRNGMDSILEEVSTRDEELGKIRDENKKLKTKGKKLIEKLKKGLKDKESLLKKLSSESGDKRLATLHDENVTLNKRIFELEHDNDTLQETISSLKSAPSDEQSNEHAMGHEDLGRIRDQIFDFISELQLVYACHVIDNDFQFESFNGVSKSILSHAQDFKLEYSSSKETIASLEEKCLNLADSLQSKSDSYKGEMEELKLTIQDLSDSNKSLKDGYNEKEQKVIELQCELERISLDNIASQAENVDNESLDVYKENLNGALGKLEALELELSCLRTTYESTCGELDVMAMKLQSSLEDNRLKDELISELKISKDDLQEFVDTLTSQVAEITDEKERLQYSFNEKLEISMNERSLETSELNNRIESQALEVKKYLGMVKKLKLIKDDLQRDLKEKEQIISEFNSYNNPKMVECIDIVPDKNDTLLITEAMQNSTFSDLHEDAPKVEQAAYLNVQIIPTSDEIQPEENTVAQTVGIEVAQSQVTALQSEGKSLGPVVSASDESTLTQLLDFVAKLQSIYDNDVIDVNNLHLDSLDELLKSVMDRAQDLKAENDCSKEAIAALEGTRTDLEKSLQLTTDGLKEISEEKDKEITDLQHQLLQFKEQLESSTDNIDVDSFNIVKEKLDEALEKSETLEWELNNLKDNFESKCRELEALEMKLQGTLEDCKSKDEIISDLNVSREDLQRFVDTLTSQVAEIADEKDKMQCSFEETLEASLNDVSLENNKLKDLVQSQSLEVKKYLAMVKKLKIIKDDLQKDLIEKDEMISELKKHRKPEMTECANADPDKTDSAPVLESQQCSVDFSNDLQDDFNVAKRPSSLDTEVEDSVSENTHEKQGLATHDEVTHLQSVISSLECSLAHNETLVKSLEDQLSESKQVLLDTRGECQTKLQEVIEENEKYCSEIASLKNDNQALIDELKVIKASLADHEDAIKTETNAKMVVEPKNQEPDRVSEASIRSKSTSYQSKSSYGNRELPNDIETLKAELMKKNKLAFFIRNRAKKAESRIKEVKRDAEKTNAHRSIKDKLELIEKDLLNVGEHLKNLSHGKKIDRSMTGPGAQNVEEMEKRIQKLTKIEEQYEKIMGELQTQIKSKNFAEQQVKELGDTIVKLEEEISYLQQDLRHKESLLHEGMDLIEERKSYDLLARDFEMQRSELLHIREINVNMKNALIRVNEDAEKIEATYKSTMHELEAEVDQLKVDKIDLCEEVKKCWANIDDLDCQNKEYMALLQENAERIRNLEVQDDLYGSDMHKLQELSNDYQQKLLISEREKTEVIKQLVELKDLYDSCLESKAEAEAGNQKLVESLRDSVPQHSDATLTEQHVFSNSADQTQSYMSLQEINASLNDKVSELTSALDHWRSIAQQQQACVESLQDEISTRDAKFGDLLGKPESESGVATENSSSDNPSVSGDNHDMQKENHVLKNLIISLEENVALLEKSLMEANDKITEHTVALENWRTFGEEQENYKKFMMVEISEKNSEIDSLREDLTNAKAQLNTLDNELRNTNANVQNEDCNQTDLNELQTNNSELQPENESDQTSYDAIQAELTVIVKELDESKTKIAEYATALEQWSTYDQEQQLYRDSLIQQNSQLSNEICDQRDALNASKVHTQNLQGELDDCKQQLDEALMKVADMESTELNAKELSAELGLRYEEIQHLKHDKEGLQKCYDELKSEASVMHGQVEEMKLQKEEATKSLEHQVKLYEEQKELCDMLTEKVSENEVEIHTLKQLVITYEKEIENLRDRDDEYAQMIKTLETYEDIDKEQKEFCKQVNVQITEKEAEVNDLKGILNCYEKEVSDLKGLLKEKQELLDEKIAEVEQQVKAAAESNNTKAEVKSLREEIELLQKEYEELQYSQKRAQEDLVSVNNELEVANLKITEYTAMLQEWQVYEQQQQAYISSLSEQLSVLSIMKDEHNKTMEESVDAKKQLEDMITELTSVKEHLENINKDLDSQIASTNNERERMETELHELLSRKDIEIDGLKEMLQDHDGKLKDLKDSLKEKEDLLQSKILELEKQAAIASDAATLEEKLTAVIEQNKTLQNEHSELEKSHESAQNDLAEADKKINECTATLTQWHVYEEQQQTFIASLRQQLAEANEMKQEHDQLLEENAVMKKELDEKDELISSNENLENLNKELKTKISSVENSYTTLEKELNEQVTLKEEEICSLKDVLEDKNKKIKVLDECVEEKEGLLKEKTLDIERQSCAAAELNDARTELDTIKEQKSALQKEYEELQHSQKTAQEDLVSVNNELEVANLKITEYTAMLQDWQVYEQQQQAYISSLSEQLSELSIMKDEHNKTMEESADAKKQLEDKVTDLTSIKEQLEKLNKELESNVCTIESSRLSIEDELRQQRKETSELREVLKEKDQALTDLEKRIVEKEDCMQDKILELEQQAALATEANIVKEEYSERNEILQRECSELQKSQSSAKEEFTKVSLALEEANRKVNEYTTTLEQCKLREEEQEAQICSLSEQLSKISDTKEKYDRMKEESDLIKKQAHDTACELLSKIGNLEIQIQELNAAVSLSENARSSMEGQLKEQMSRKEKEVLDLKEKLSVNEQQVKDLLNSVTEKDKLLQQKITQEAEQAAISAERNEANEKWITVTEEKEALQKEYSRLQKSQVTAREDLGKVIKNLEEANRKVYEYHAKLEERQIHEQEQQAYIESLLEQEKLHKSEITQTRDECNKIMEENALSKKQIESKISTLLSTINQHENLNNELSSKVQAAENALAISEKQHAERISSKDKEVNSMRETLRNSEQKLKDLQEQLGKAQVSLNEKISRINELTTAGVKANVTVEELKLVQEKYDQLQKENSDLRALEKDVNENCKSLRDGIAVFQERDRILNETMEKLRTHSETVTAHANELNSKIVQLEGENRCLKQQLSSKTLTAVDANAEVDTLKLEKDKMHAEINNYKAQLDKSHSNLSVLEKSLSHMTVQYNEQITIASEKKQEFSKLAKHYNHLKDKYLCELNNRKKLVRETITGRDKVNQKIGEKSRQLKVSIMNLFFLHFASFCDLLAITYPENHI